MAENKKDLGSISGTVKDLTNKPAEEKKDNKKEK